MFEFAQLFMFCTCDSCEFTYYNVIIMIDPDRKDYESNKYFNLCCSKNEMLNNYYYARGDLHDPKVPWFFIIRDRYLRLEEDPRFLLLENIWIDNIVVLNEVLKELNRSVKTQINTMYSALLQAQKHRLFKQYNNMRTAYNYKFKAESIKTTDRTHKQRADNITSQLELFKLSPAYVSSCHDIFARFICLIKKRSNESFSQAQKAQHSQPLIDSKLTDFLSNYSRIQTEIEPHTPSS
jgi:hypothetical protein